MELKNINETRNIIEKVEPYSIAEELNFEVGDRLVSINDEIVKDIIDYKYLINDDYIVVRIEKQNKDIYDFEIEKDYNEDLGILFTNPLIDKAKRCSNKCIFCFIDQLPPNMRDTLYFKDDDSRLSFLQGNFITLTNMRDDEIDRIIKYRLSPINISVHTTNPELRVQMLNNKKAGRIMEILERFHEVNLEVNCQIVLVPGVNDGKELERTISDLSRLHPTIGSVAVVPIGVTKYREGLTHVKTFDKDMSTSLIEDITKIQNELLENIGTRFVFLSDEFYALSGKDLLSYDEYEGFRQYENGVGMMKLFEVEVDEYLEKLGNYKLNSLRKIILPTGVLAYEFMNKIARKIENNISNVEIQVVKVYNDFFGHTITVAGLLTGNDIISQLKGISGDAILISKSMLKADEDIFLDDVTLEEFETKVNKKVIVTEVDGEEFIKNIINNEEVR